MIPMDTENILISQYGASLGMLRAAVETCPDRLWDLDAYKNRSWHIAYHALFYAHLYLSRGEGAFVPWERSAPEYQFLGRLPWPPHAEPKIGGPYSRSDLLDYSARVADLVAPQVRAVPLEEPSGFHWLPFSRLELHVYNIRHIQHHAGQLIDRIRTEGGTGIDWVGVSRGE